MISRVARAKINLALHVTGRRSDGYHLLDSLVVFAAVGDGLRVAASDRLSLSIDGPFAAGLDTGAENLVMRAARALRPEGAGAALFLEKRLPVAAGIGGGSADAAAALSLLSEHWGVAVPEEAALSLGADVPVCLAGRPARMRGIGENLQPVTLPPVWLVLANRLAAVPTGAVFSALASRDNPPLPDLPALADAQALADWLGRTRNDLEPAALRIEPGIADVLDALRASGSLLARMSGSGGTCFGIFAEEAAARAACAGIAAAHPEWWCVAAPA